MVSSFFSFLYVLLKKKKRDLRLDLSSIRTFRKCPDLLDLLGERANCENLTMTKDQESWTRFDSLFKKYGEIYGVEWKWLKAFALVESDLGRHPSVRHGILHPSDVLKSQSSDGLSWGLMQVTVRTARDLDPNATAEKLNDPEYSINLAARYIKQIKRHFARLDPRFLEWVVKSYNQGPGRTQKEMAQLSAGFADTYWTKWQVQYKHVCERDKA